MKRAVSISLGSSKRDKQVEIELMGQHLCLERIGTDGDVERAAALFAELDGEVDAFGLGGINLEILTPWKSYPLVQARRLIRHVRHTPVVDGGMLKATLERQAMTVVEQEIGDQIWPKTALITVAIERSGLTQGFVDAGYACVFGDLMFSLGIPFPVRRLVTLQRTARVLLPAARRIPISWLYPTGEKQDRNQPKYEKYYRWATVVAGDFLYVRQHMPLRMDGKVVVTNTTTAADIDFLSRRGVRYLVTTTPVFDGRSFGTNLLEAALVAAGGKGRRLTYAELEEMLAQLALRPQIREL
jgi:hypothetical protein